MISEIPVGKYMTISPKSIAHNQTLGQASDYMRKLHIRHLPVVKAGKLIGVLSDRDLGLALYFQDQRALDMTVGEALTEPPFFASVDHSLRQVASEMAAHNYAYALIMDNGRLAGIFTYIDALKALAQVLRNEERKLA